MRIEVGHIELYDKSVRFVKAKTKKAFCPTGEGGGQDNSCSPHGGPAGGGGGAGAAEAKPAEAAGAAAAAKPETSDTQAGATTETQSASKPVKKAVKEILDAASEITFDPDFVTEGSSSNISDDDYDAIERAMTHDEIIEMEESLNEMANSMVDEYVSQDEGFEFDQDAAYDDVDYDEAATEAGHSHEEIRQRVRQIVEGNEAAEKLVDEWDGRHTNGVSAIEDLKQQLDDAVDDDGNSLLSSDAASEIDGYRDEAEESINNEVDNQIENMRREQEEKYNENLRDSYLNDYDNTDDKEHYLREFYENNSERFQKDSSEGDQPLNTWVTDGEGRKGDMTLGFETKSGRRFNINTLNRTQGGQAVTEIQFSDENGDFQVTDKGEAFEVFSKVAPAVVAYMQANPDAVVYFSAAKSPATYQAAGAIRKNDGLSRQRLYSRMTDTLLSVDSSKFKLEKDYGYAKGYILVPNSKREQILAAIPLDASTVLSEGGQRAAMDNEPDFWQGWHEAKAGKFNPAWWNSKDSWGDDEEDED